ncbi:MAG: hypothetical protein ABEK16_04300 [Candidatus Nanohalobium sp.]
MSSPEHGKLLHEISESYEKDGYNAVAVDESFPGIFVEHSGEDKGRVDLLLEDTYSPTYKVVEVVKCSNLDPGVLDSKFESSYDDLEKNVDYFDSIVDQDVVPELVLSTQENLHTVREIWEESVKTFTWDQAVEWVSDTGRLGEIRDERYIRLKHDISREEDEEVMEFNEQLHELTDYFIEAKLYP